MIIKAIMNKNGSAITQVNIVIIAVSLFFIVGYSFLNERYFTGVKKKEAVVITERIAEGEKLFSTGKKYLFIEKGELKDFKNIDVKVNQFKYFDYWVEKYDKSGFIVHARTKDKSIRQNELPPLHYAYKYLEGKIDKGEWVN